MQYSVYCCSRSTGEDATLTIEAPTPAAAEAKANDMGFVVESVSAVASPAGGGGAAPPTVPVAMPAQPSDAELISRAYQRSQANPPIVVRPIPTVQTIEKTGKKWKLLMLIGSVMFIGGIGTCVASMQSATSSSDPSPVLGLASLVAIVGFLVAVVARVGAWWNHG